MLSQWVTSFLVTMAGIAYVSGNPCDTSAPTACYSDLVHYESLAFPFYGENEAKLEDVCGNINMSFDCVKQYMETCQRNPECDDECQELISDIRSFVRNTGLKNLEEELCDPYSPLRQTYLDNVHCLQENADMYASCHNDSQRSQHYLSTKEMEVTDIELRCCFFKWYDECFKNITEDHCGENATFFVSLTLHKLTGDIRDQLCGGVTTTCTRPPLPPEDYEVGTTDKTDEGLHKDKTTETTDKSDKDLDKDKKDETTEISDNTIPDSHASTIKSHAVNWILLHFLCICLFKYIL